MSGIAAAYKDNGRGVAGVAPDAELIVAKVLSATGTGSSNDVTAGIKWVVDHGAQVVNLSLGDPAMVITSLITPNDLREGVEYAWAHGVVPIVAAGNSNAAELGLEGQSYGDMNAIIVGATGPDDHTATYSTSTGNAKWALVAPGGAANGDKADDVISTFWIKGKSNSYGSLAGTSMAAPQVTGAIALLLSEGYTPGRARTTAGPLAGQQNPQDPTNRDQRDAVRAPATGAASRAGIPFPDHQPPGAGTSTSGRHP